MINSAVEYEAKILGIDPVVMTRIIVDKGGTFGVKHFGTVMSTTSPPEISPGGFDCATLICFRGLTK